MSSGDKLGGSGNARAGWTSCASEFDKSSWTEGQALNATIGSQIHEFVDDYCGTRPPKWPGHGLGHRNFTLLNCLP